MTPSTFDAPTPEAMNRLLPAFDFTALLSSDDMSAVYFAKQRSLERDVAIKVLAPHVSGSPEFRQSFETTARKMARLNHPNLIGVYDSGYVDGMLYFIMEFVPGKSLERSSKGQRVEFKQAVTLAAQLCAGLAHAHDHGIVHGDLHASNILLNQKAEPKIGNFGFTHPPGAEADPRPDILAVGAILYQLVTGREHAADASPPSVLADSAAGLDAVWKQATHPDPARRFADMRAFQKALTGLISTARPAAPAGPGPANPAARPPVAAMQQPVAAPPLKKKANNYTGLLVQAVVLGALIVATPMILKKMQSMRDEQRRKIQEDHSQKTDAEKETLDREIRAAQEKARQAKNTDSPSTKVPRPEPKSESPAQSLGRLRDSLANGERGEMPVGSVPQGTSDYFLVTESMSWPEASWFAEQHGGHLAIPNTSADLKWLAANVSKSEAVWIGAAKSGVKEWALIDGTPWSPSKEPGGTGSYLALDRSGFLRTAGVEQRLPFIIQWHRDGQNPGKLATVLAKTRESLGKSSPVFPPGTMVSGNRRYLIVARPLTWRDAVDFAESSGGHLAVASESAEMTGITQLTSGSPARDGLWLGGCRKGDQWAWITGEPWNAAKWADDASEDSPDTALILRPGKGWDSRGLSETSPGLIIEWSEDRKAKPAAGSPTVEITALVTRAKDLLDAAEKKRSEKLAANVRKVHWDYDIFLRNLPSGDQAIWSRHVMSLKDAAANNRVPVTIPESSGIKLTDKMSKIAQDGAAQQDKIDQEFLLEAERVRIAFITKLRESLAQAEKSGQRALAQSINTTLTDCANLADWLRSQDIEPKPEPPSFDDSEEKKPRKKRDKNKSENAPPVVE